MQTHKFLKRLLGKQILMFGVIVIIFLSLKKKYIVSGVFEIFRKNEAKKKTLFSCMITTILDYTLYGKVKS